MVIMPASLETIESLIALDEGNWGYAPDPYEIAHIARNALDSGDFNSFCLFNEICPIHLNHYEICLDDSYGAIAWKGEEGAICPYAALIIMNRSIAASIHNHP